MSSVQVPLSHFCSITRCPANNSLVKYYDTCVQCLALFSLLYVLCMQLWTIVTHLMLWTILKFRHGYIKHHRGFLRQYRALPVIGAQRNSTSDGGADSSPKHNFLMQTKLANKTAFFFASIIGKSSWNSLTWVKALNYLTTFPPCPTLAYCEPPNIPEARRMNSSNTWAVC